MNNSAVIIAESSWLIRKGLIQSLEEMNIKTGIYECDDMEQLRDRLSVFYIHYVFLNPALIQGNNAGILELKTENPSLVVIGLTENDNEDSVKYFDHVLPVNAGKSEIGKKLNAIFKQKEAKDASANTGLSEREKSILTLVARGRTNQEIADELFISTHTVISHRKNITRKLGIKTVAGLAVYAVINNLADASDLK